MSDVTLTIDGREVTVPPGTGLVEAAAARGVEIPVFCYEPRIGPPVGACRMCLVEIEGMPKLQAACATAVRPGMVVSTVSGRARAAQEAVLEFLLVNHPLDCPVCDKGGECPLQDHAFRWGPGASRFGEIKRVNDKPIPISPLIALDRERCILCYRCTRFSDEVTGDLQLVTRQRGSRSVIATFEGRPYEGHHSGNVIELCPVGALTSTEFRFRARPWEAPDHPSVSWWDPAGSNIWNTVREGRVVRVLSRPNDAVDRGWIDDRTRFAYPAMYSPARIVAPQQRPHRERPMGNRPVVEPSFEVALEWLHDNLTAPLRWQPDPKLEEQGEQQEPPARELWVLSGNETLEVVHAIQQVAAQTGGRVVAIPGGSAAAPAAGAAIADLEGARRILVLGDADLLDVAPTLDLWIRRATQDGAQLTVAGIGGTKLAQVASALEHVAAGELDAWVERFCTRMRDELAGVSPTEAGIVVYRDGELSPQSLELLTSTFDLPREGSGLLAIPAAANARGLAALGVECGSWDDILQHTGGVVYVGVDPDRHVEPGEWGPAAKRAAWVACVDVLPAAVHQAADLVLPGAFGAEQEGTLVNLEGRLQRLTVAAEPPAPHGAPAPRPPLGWLSGLARRMGASVPSHAAGAFRQLAEAHPGRFPVTTHGAIPAGGCLGVTGGPQPVGSEQSPPEPGDGELALYVAPFLYDAPEVEHTPAMRFLRDETRLYMSRIDAAARGMSRGDAATIEIDGRDVEVTVVTSARIAPRHARVHAGTPGIAAGRVGWRTTRVTPAGHPARAAAAASTGPDAGGGA